MDFAQMCGAHCFILVGKVERKYGIDLRVGAKLSILR